MSEHDGPRLHRTVGRVVEVHRDRAILELEVSPADVGKKPECGGCGLCSADRSGRVELRAYLAEGVVVQKGDRVEAEIRLVAPGRAALLLYGMPLLAFVGTSMIVWFATGGSQNASAVSGFSALAAAFLLLFLIERGRGPSARVVRKL